MRCESHAIVNKRTGRKVGSGSYDCLHWCSEEFKKLHFIFPLGQWSAWGRKYKAFINSGTKTDEELQQWRAQN